MINPFSYLNTPVHIASLVFFRIAFGSILLFDLVRLLNNGSISIYFVDPSFHFSSLWNKWGYPISSAHIHAYIFALAALAVCIVSGFIFRLSMVLFLLGYCNLMVVGRVFDPSYYYLAITTGMMLTMLPANRYFAIDSKIRPRISTKTVPCLAIFAIKLQVCFCYAYIGFSKFNASWFSGESITSWASQTTRISPTIQQFLMEESTAQFFSYGIILLNILIIPLLFINRTRKYAIIIGIVYHITSLMINTSVPHSFIMIAGTMIFLPPSWPCFYDLLNNRKNADSNSEIEQNSVIRIHPITACGLTVFFVGQIGFMINLYFNPIFIGWKGHDHAWVRQLDSQNPKLRMFATDRSKRISWELFPEMYLTQWQIEKMKKSPDMIHEFSCFLSKVLTETPDNSIEIYAIAQIHDQHGKIVNLIDPTVNLASELEILGKPKWLNSNIK